MIQSVIVSLCLLAAVGYAFRRVRHTFLRRQNPCCGCEGCGCDGCESKKFDCDKKTAKKFGDSK